MTDTTNDYDVLVIGGGVVGAAILWELAKYDLRLALLEKRADVAEVTTKANSSIAHTGFDAKPGTLESACIVASNPKWDEICDLLEVPFRRCGAILVALDDEQLASLEAILAESRANGVNDVRRLGIDEMRTLEPNLNPAARGGLLVPRESITTAWLLAIAYAENAVLNGAQVYLQHPVTALQPTEQGIIVTTPQRTFRARWVINAAGLGSDAIAAMVGDDSFAITPRKGEFFVLDRMVGDLVSHIILPVPSLITKGILVTPTVDGNLILGPTADDIQDKTDTLTTTEGLKRVAEATSKLVPALDPYRTTITQYAGLRAVCSTGHWEVRPSERCPRLIHAAGIRSTGMSGSPEIARRISEMLAEQGLALRPRPGYQPRRPAIPLIREATPAEAEELCRRDPRYGHLVCRCEQVSEAEIVQAIHAPIPATTLDGIKRRVRAGAGRCQGGFCGPRVLEILARELGTEISHIAKSGPGGEVVTERNKAAWRADPHES